MNRDHLRLLILLSFGVPGPCGSRIAGVLVGAGLATRTAGAITTVVRVRNCSGLNDGRAALGQRHVLRGPGAILVIGGFDTVQPDGIAARSKGAIQRDARLVKVQVGNILNGQRHVALNHDQIGDTGIAGCVGHRQS